MKKQLKKRDTVIYVYSTKENKKFVEDICTEYNQPITAIVNEIIKAYRVGEKPKFVKRIPKYVHKAVEWQNRK